jgi:hypothetical protein
MNSGLPIFQIPDESELPKTIAKKKYSGGMYDDIKIPAFIEGYETAGGYSEEDMKQFGLFLGQNIKRLKNELIDDIFSEYIRDRRKPVAVIVEMEKLFDHDKKGKTHTTDEKEAYHGAAYVWQPKVVDNRIEILEIQFQ